FRRVLFRSGADVVIAYLSEHEDANVTRLAVESAGRRALLAPGDLDSDGTCKALAEKAAREFGRIDILVNNAAYQGKSVKKFEELDAERVEKTFGVNYPMERPAQPAELAPAYVFLANDESRYVNGEVLGVTGGKPLG